MRRQNLLFPVLWIIFHAGAALAQGKPDLYAYITRVASSTDFDIDGLHVLLTPATIFQTRTGKAVSPLSNPAPYVGQMASLWGHVDRKALTIQASRLQFIQPEPEVVSGSAIIDLLPASPADVHRLRADGRVLEISPSVLDHPVPLKAGSTPPASSADLRTNVWIDYHGLRRADGVVTLDQASFSDNQVSKSEASMRKKHDYDPDAIPDDAHQSGASRAFKGTDPKQIPPSHDPAMQDRIDRVGKSLIPAYQRALPTDDPTRIDFRFQLVDEPKWRDAMTLPSGIILVPKQVVARLPDDAELASVLADKVACALEKQSYRLLGPAHQLTAAEIGGDVAGLFIPGAGIATEVAAGGARKHLITAAEQQSGRVALTLMYDAGYDIDKAPEAWWILATKEGRDPHGASPPGRAANQFDELGTTWQPANREALKASRANGQ